MWRPASARSASNTSRDKDGLIGNRQRPRWRHRGLCHESLNRDHAHHLGMDGADVFEDAGMVELEGVTVILVEGGRAEQPVAACHGVQLATPKQAPWEFKHEWWRSPL